MSTIDTLTVAEVVTENIKAAHIFKKHGIDFCCGGGISIKKACEKNNVNYDTIINEINDLQNEPSSFNDYNSWKLDFLIDFIENTHHKYVEENIPLLKQCFDPYKTRVIF